MSGKWTEEEKEICRRMRKTGYSYRAIGQVVGKHPDTVKMFVRRDGPPKERIPQKDTLCWHCGLATGGPSGKTGEPCSWAKGLKPVPGWDAEAVTIRCYNSEGTYEGMTWSVKDCPLFEKG